jgi:hypothetical protein
MPARTGVEPRQLSQVPSGRDPKTRPQRRTTPDVLAIAACFPLPARNISASSRVARAHRRNLAHREVGTASRRPLPMAATPSQHQLPPCPEVAARPRISRRGTGTIPPLASFTGDGRWTSHHRCRLSIRLVAARLNPPGIKEPGDVGHRRGENTRLTHSSVSAPGLESESRTSEVTG